MAEKRNAWHELVKITAAQLEGALLGKATYLYSACSPSSRHVGWRLGGNGMRKWNDEKDFSIPYPSPHISTSDPPNWWQFILLPISTTKIQDGGLTFCKGHTE